MKDPDRTLENLTRLARSAAAPEQAAPPAFTDEILRRLRAVEPESAAAIWQFFAVRALPWATAAVVIAAGLNAVVTSTPLPSRDPASELLAQLTQP